MNLVDTKYEKKLECYLRKKIFFFASFAVGGQAGEGSETLCTIFNYISNYKKIKYALINSNELTRFISPSSLKNVISRRTSSCFAL